MTSQRYKPEIRRELVLRAAVEVARVPGGWSTLTRQNIAVAADCSEGLVSRYLGNMKSARRHIMKEACRQAISEIIMQSVIAHDGYAIPKSTPAEKRQQYLQNLLGL